MTNCDVLRAISTAMNLDDDRLVEIFALAGHELTARKAAALVDPGEGTPCSEDRLRGFLDGVIIDKRGPRDPNLPPVVPERLTNNEILKKLRIAWNLKEIDVLAAFAAGGQELGKSEASALFRKRQNKHHRRCSDDTLAAFIRGLPVTAR